MPGTVTKIAPEYPKPKEVDHLKLAYETQARIRELKEELAREEEELKYHIQKANELNQTSKIYVVTDLKPKRVAKLQWFRENMPEVYDQLAKVSATNAVDIIGKNLGGEHEFQTHLRRSFPEEFDAAATILVTKLDALLGKKKTLELKNLGAIEVHYTASKDTRIIRKDEPEQLTEGDDE